MEMEPWTEPRKQRLKRKRRAWPKWLRSKQLVRWLFVAGPFAYRIYKMVFSIFSSDDG
jgi:hypothetical protein